jgi:hypothetical protein
MNPLRFFFGILALPLCVAAQPSLTIDNQNR